MCSLAVFEFFLSAFLVLNLLPSKRDAPSSSSFPLNFSVQLLSVCACVISGQTSTAWFTGHSGKLSLLFSFSFSFIVLSALFFKTAALSAMRIWFSFQKLTLNELELKELKKIEMFVVKLGNLSFSVALEKENLKKRGTAFSKLLPKIDWSLNVAVLWVITVQQKKYIPSIGHLWRQFFYSSSPLPLHTIDWSFDLPLARTNTTSPFQFLYLILKRQI